VLLAAFLSFRIVKEIESTNIRNVGAGDLKPAVTYVDRILRGAKPADLPVQFATKFNLAMYMETAKALGLNVSQQLQFLADEVIE
jgi:putative tryptophan/tyrosine transport system substrate-binding protein